MSNRSAVFGGAGFIGTNLVYQLIEDGQQVFNFDNLSGLGNLLNIAELMQQSRTALLAAIFPILRKFVRRCSWPLPIRSISA